MNSSTKEDQASAGATDSAGAGAETTPSGCGVGGGGSERWQAIAVNRQNSATDTVRTAVGMNDIWGLRIGNAVILATRMCRATRYGPAYPQQSVCENGPRREEFMEAVLEILRWVHVAAGFTGLAAFWVPVFTAKGGPRHRLFGRVFKTCAWLVLGAAAVSICLHIGEGLADGQTPSTAPNTFAFLVFLAYLTLVTFVVLRHGLQVLQHKQGLQGMNRWTDRWLARLAIASSVGLIVYALYFDPPVKIVLFALSPIGFAGGFGILKAIRGGQPERMAWFYEHLSAMLATGIAFHTAFAVFGSSRIFSLQTEGFAAVVPWILPALVGIPAISLWTRHYRRRFGDHRA